MRIVSESFASNGLRVIFLRILEYSKFTFCSIFSCVRLHIFIIINETVAAIEPRFSALFVILIVRNR